VEKVIVPDVHETLGYVFDAIKLTKEMLNDEVPLIGFAGSPDNYVLCSRRKRF
jgi:uroporphyrinogen decarboxylase